MDSPQGQALKLRFPGQGELLGHAAIRAYYEIDGGVDIEITDFSDPDKFPAVIVRAIQRGDFRGVAQPEGLLNQIAKKQYRAVADPAWKQYRAVADTAKKQYRAVADTAKKQYRAVVDTAFWDLFANSKNRAEAWKVGK